MSSEFYRSLGLELAGPKNDRTSLAVMDFHPKTQKLILVDVQTGLGESDNASSDEVLYSHLQTASLESRKITGLAVHGPVSLPPAFVESLARRGSHGPPRYKAENQQIEWMFQVWKKLHPQPKSFVPYIQRPAEIYLRHLTPEKFQIPDALGANFAPITARMQYLKPHISHTLNEIFPKATLSRIVSSLGLTKNINRDYLDMEKGLYTRELFFDHLAKKLPQIFLYEKDLDLCITQISAFNSFLAALNQHLVFKKQCETPPTSFPKSATWIHIPKRGIKWADVFT